MSFNLFDESTWSDAVSKQDLQTKIKNKALGHMGQFISEIRYLKEQISKEADLSSNIEYVIAEGLRTNNAVAFEQMEIRIIYPNDNISALLKTIDEVLDFWRDKELRERKWKSILPKFKELKPYLKDRRTYGLYDRSAENIKTLANIKVEGNEAWKLYIGSYKNYQYWHKAWSELSEKVRKLSPEIDVDDSPESEDYDDE